MTFQHLVLKIKRAFWRRRCHHPAMRALLDTPIAQLPFNQTRYVVIDLETTALDPQQGEIASIGWVVIEHLSIDLSQSQHHLVAVQQEVGQSAIFHELTDSDLQQANPIEYALNALLPVIHNSHLVFHHASMDMQFLNRASKTLFGCPILLPIHDTMTTEDAILNRQNHIPANDDLRLYRCRQRYGLYDIPAHNAFNDALATAELWLAQLTHRN